MRRIAPDSPGAVLPAPALHSVAVQGATRCKVFAGQAESQLERLVPVASVMPMVPGVPMVVVMAVMALLPVAAVSAVSIAVSFGNTGGSGNASGASASAGGDARSTQRWR